MVNFRSPAQGYRRVYVRARARSAKSRAVHCYSTCIKVKFKGSWAIAAASRGRGDYLLLLCAFCHSVGCPRLVFSTPVFPFLFNFVAEVTEAAGQLRW